MKSEYHKYESDDSVFVEEWYGCFAKATSVYQPNPFTIKYYHREDGPAEIRYVHNVIQKEVYYLNNQPHRSNGPAKVWYNGDGSVYDCEYYLFGKEITEQQFNTPGFVDAIILENS